MLKHEIQARVFGGVDKPEWTCSELCMSEPPTGMRSAAGLATNAAGAVTA